MVKTPKKSTKSPKSGHSQKIESLAGKTLANPSAGKVAKKLAGAVLSHSDGKPNKTKK